MGSDTVGEAFGISVPTRLSLSRPFSLFCSASSSDVTLSFRHTHRERDCERSIDHVNSLVISISANVGMTQAFVLVRKERALDLLKVYLLSPLCPRDVRHVEFSSAATGSDGGDRISVNVKSDQNSEITVGTRTPLRLNTLLCSAGRLSATVEENFQTFILLYFILCICSCVSCPWLCLCFSLSLPSHLFFVRRAASPPHCCLSLLLMGHIHSCLLFSSGLQPDWLHK